MEDYRICSETGRKITRDDVISCISDTYKSVNGIRPRWMDFSDWSFEEMGDYLTELQEQAEKQAIEEEKWEAEQVELFKQLVDRYINEFGAGSEETALKWILDGEGKFFNPQCVEGMLYRYGILFTEYGKTMFKKFCQVATWDTWESN